jgi:hypothetical protein
MWYLDLIYGFWNGITAWVVLIVHIFGGWQEFPFYDIARSGGWYDFGFLVGAGSPLLGAAGSRRSSLERPEQHSRRVQAAEHTA